MTRSGTAYRLPVLVPLTNATGSGLWPTPLANQGGTSPKTLEMASAGTAHMTLDRAVALARLGLWPTPTAQDKSTAERLETWLPRAERTGYLHLPLRMVASACETGPKPGHLNPPWVEWLMGFPINWTALEL